MPPRFNAPRLWSTLALTCALSLAAQTLLAVSAPAPAPVPGSTQVSGLAETLAH